MLLLIGEIVTLVVLLDDDVVWSCTTPSVLSGAVVVLLDDGIVWNCATSGVLAGVVVVCLVCEELVKVVLGTW